MKKLIFLGLIVLYLISVHLTIQAASETQITSARQRQLEKAIKKRDLKTIIEKIKNIKQTNGSMEIFHNKKLLELASKKFVSKRACMNDSSFTEEVLYVLIPIFFIMPYAVFYHRYNALATPMTALHATADLKKATTISILSTLFLSLSCLVQYSSKTRACKESKLIYKILKKHFSQNEIGEMNV